jgi:hypothetical protein
MDRHFATHHLETECSVLESPVFRHPTFAGVESVDQILDEKLVPSGAVRCG